MPEQIDKWLMFSGLGEQVGVEQPHPKFIKGTKEHHFVRVAAGAGNSLALTSSGQIWSFGQGGFGILGMPWRENLQSWWICLVCFEAAVQTLQLQLRGAWCLLT